MTQNARLIEFARDKDSLAEKFAPEVIWLLLRDLANALEATEKENQQLKIHYQQAIKDLKEVEARLAELEGFTRRGMGLLKIWRSVDHEVVATTARVQTDAYLKAAKEVLGHNREAQDSEGKG